MKYLIINDSLFQQIEGGKIMENLDQKLLQTISIFCEHFKLNRPKTNDIFVWWFEETKKMSLDTLNVCLEALGSVNSDLCNQMCIVLEVRRQEILDRKKYVLYAKEVVAV